MGSLFGRNNNFYSNQNDKYNKFQKTTNDIFGIGKDMFSAYNGFGGGSYGGIIGGGINAGLSALNGGSWKEDIPQSFFGIDDHKDSDVMQTLKGAGKGAMMGAPFGPIGMVVGALLGTGASFLDDI